MKKGFMRFNHIPKYKVFTKIFFINRGKYANVRERQGGVLCRKREEERYFL